jgi:hypothetical protein
MPGKMILDAGYWMLDKVKKVFPNGKSLALAGYIAREGVCN